MIASVTNLYVMAPNSFLKDESRSLFGAHLLGSSTNRIQGFQQTTRIADKVKVLIFGEWFRWVVKRFPWLNDLKLGPFQSYDFPAYLTSRHSKQLVFRMVWSVSAFVIFLLPGSQESVQDSFPSSFANIRLLGNAECHPRYAHEFFYHSNANTYYSSDTASTTIRDYFHHRRLEKFVWVIKVSLQGFRVQ